jgi:hypothetical protein
MMVVNCTFMELPEFFHVVWPKCSFALSSPPLSYPVSIQFRSVFKLALASNMKTGLNAIWSQVYSILSTINAGYPARCLVAPRNAQIRDSQKAFPGTNGYAKVLFWTIISL